MATVASPAVQVHAAGRPRAVLGAAGTAHFLHDGFSDVLYVLLPAWAAEFGLSFTQVGLIRTVYTGGMALFQIPAGFLAERWGERRLLAAGTAVTALGFMAAGWSGGFASLLALLLLYWLGLPALSGPLLGLPLAGRLAVAIVSLAPLGTLMGMPFPASLARLQQKSPGLVAWAWGVNGALSVVAVSLKKNAELSWGFGRVLLLGTACYLLVWLTTAGATRSRQAADAPPPPAR